MRLFVLIFLTCIVQCCGIITIEGYSVLHNPDYDGKVIDLNTKYRIENVIVDLAVSNSNGKLVGKTRRGPYNISVLFATSDNEYTVAEIDSIRLISSLSKDYKFDDSIVFPLQVKFKNDNRFENTGNRYALVSFPTSFNFNFNEKEVITVEVKIKCKKNGSMTEIKTFIYKCFPQKRKYGSLV